MADYIDREATADALDKLCDRVCQYSKKQRYTMCGACPLGDAFTVIEDEIPAADVAPVRHGHWRKGVGENGVTSAFFCSECGFEDSRYELFNYCPNCGARMDGANG